MNRDRWFNPPRVLLDEWRDRQMAASPRTVETLYGPKALVDLLGMQAEYEADRFVAQEIGA